MSMTMRAAGWVLVNAYGRMVSHYFAEGQNKALCGNAESLPNEKYDPLPRPIQTSTICKRCLKYNGMRVLRESKK